MLFRTSAADGANQRHGHEPSAAEFQHGYHGSVPETFPVFTAFLMRVHPDSPFGIFPYTPVTPLSLYTMTLKTGFGSRKTM